MLSSYKNKDYIAKTLFKEMNNDNPDFMNICAVIMLEVLDKNVFEKYAIEFLKNSEIDDEKKFFVISIIKQMGIHFDYDDIPSYVKNPEKLTQNSVQNFLDNILYDPEVQLDLLDFYSNIPIEEKLFLLDNFANEKINDNIIKAFSLLSRLDVTQEEFEIILNVLLKSRSPYAIEGLEYIIQNYKLKEELRSQIEKTLKIINFSNRNFKDYNLILNTSIFESLISFVDGHSNFSLILTRKTQNALLNTALITINIELGITSCVGFFNIEFANYLKIKKRLFVDSYPIKISPMILKSLIVHFENKNKKTQTQIPYEFFIWKKFLENIDTINYEIFEFLKNKLETINLDEKKVKDIINSKILATWYFCENENKTFDELIKKIEKDEIVQYEKIQTLISICTKELLNDKSFMRKLKNALMMNSYVALLSNFASSSLILYSMCFKNPYMELFIESLIDKSLYNYFIQSVQNMQNSYPFKIKKKTNFTKEQLEILLKKIEEKWK